MIYLQMAWRNLWRNRNRTLITVSSVFFALILALFIRSIKIGSYNHIITSALSLSTGFIQVQDTGFFDSKSLENSMVLNDTQITKAKAVKGVKSAVPRIESFALASLHNKTQSVSIIGTDPTGEAAMNGLNTRVTQGKYFHSDSGKSVLVGEELARRLGVKVGDTLVLLSQGYFGMSAAGAFLIEGIVKIPLPDLNNSAVYMPLGAAQWFFSMPGRVTSLVIMLHNPDQENHASQKLRNIFPENYDVLTWRKLIPELVQGIEFSNASGLIMLGILYLVIGFGIFGTVMMLTSERHREFSVLISIGMKPSRLGVVLFIETVIIAFLGAVLGAFVSLPFLLYMRAHPVELSGLMAQVTVQYGFEPILPFWVSGSLFVHQGLVVFVIALLVSLYPLWAVNRLRLSDELRA